jgi:hypothetical protein
VLLTIKKEEVMAKRNVKDNAPKQSHIHEVKVNRMEKKMRMLSKRYPGNKYEIKDDGKRSFIIRTSGRRPHTVSKKSAGFVKKVAEVLVGMVGLEKKG